MNTVLPSFLDSRLIDTPPPPGYWIDWSCGAWRSLPWPERPEDVPPSLGFGAIAWAENNLVHHLTGQPWRYTKPQKRFLILYYAVDSRGRWLYRRAIMRRAKGVGKDPFGASLLHVEGHAPVMFAGFDPRTRQPVGTARYSALVQILANSEGQGKDVLRVANAMVSKRMKLATGFTGGQVKSACKSGVIYEVLTSSEASAEGDPADFILINENHHATESNNGHAMGGLARRNVGKSPGGVARTVELTNAFELGRDSEAERSWKAWQEQVKGKTVLTDILYDSCEAPAYLGLRSEEDVALALQAAYADAPWSDHERLKAEIDDTSTSAADAIRYYYNQSGDNESSWISPRAFDARIRDLVVAERDVITLFLDCSKNDDATALGACRVEGRHSFHLATWQRPRGVRASSWIAPRDEVDAVVRAALARYRVVWLGIDPSPVKDDDENPSLEAEYWRPIVDNLHRDFASKLLVWASPGRNSVEFDMRLSKPGAKERNRLFTEEAMLAVKEFEGEVDPETGLLIAQPTGTWDGDATVRLHVHNARRRANPWGFSLSKKSQDSGDKVDAAVTMVGARLGATLVVRSGKIKKKSTLVAHSW